MAIEDQPAVKAAERLWTSARRLASERGREQLEALLVTCGVHVGGDMPWDPVVSNTRVFGRILRAGTLGAGEAYVDGDWECTALDELSARIMRAGIDRRVGPSWRELAESLVGHFVDRQLLARPEARAHYDLSDALYAAMLGPTLVYSCAYWRSASTLDDAQRAKLELVCAKLELARGHTVLDVGCGYGELAKYASERYGVSVVGITTSQNHAELARERCAKLPVETVVQDWRKIRGRFDRIVSLGMFEHVGDRHSRRFLECMHDALTSDGLMLLHTIGTAIDTASIDPWIERYIFPGAILPSQRQLTAAIDGLFVIEDWHNFGAGYDRTLMAWHDNFERAWTSLGRYGERFRRRWRYYLLTSAGAFRARRSQLWQVVLSPHGRMGGYQRPLQ